MTLGGMEANGKMPKLEETDLSIPKKYIPSSDSYREGWTSFGKEMMDVYTILGGMGPIGMRLKLEEMELYHPKYMDTLDSLKGDWMSFGDRRIFTSIPQCGMETIGLTTKLRE